jgi:phosphatidylserine/phosphatidylglycerophosphate/cardiolipin synthase-like enzyme
MAKFLDTTGVSYHLQQLINQAQDTLILISPYLKVNERLRQSLDDKDRMKIDVRVIYGKNELQPDQINWLKALKSVRTSFCENLHAKCYLNESEAIVTSMNLYEFSQVNNQEMGIYVTKAEDPQLYDEIYNEARRLIRISDEVRLSVERIVEPENATAPKTTGNKKAKSSEKGYCMRCKKEIALNPSAPYCIECYKSWKKYENFVYQEKYCHICGKETASTMSKPVCIDCYKKRKELFVVKN